jgi:tetratricopeptide (TPR) repeat protein
MAAPTRSTGQKPGQRPEQTPPAGFSWGDYLASLVEAEGTLTAVAWKLLQRGGPEDVASVERALRRLRARGQRDGGSWGQRLLRTFGVPRAVEDRLRWMGLYHSPFGELPLPLCIDQLRLWDRPPISESRARVWLQLGLASTALRGREFAEAAGFLDQAAAVASLPEDARIELALARGYLASRVGSSADVEAQLDAAQALLAGSCLDPGDRACFVSRLVDQRAFQHNRAGDSAAALALYRSLPAADTHPFASYRRDAGLAYGLLRAGQRDEALLCARRACEHAGDGGYSRLRVMALILIARVEGPPAALGTLQRASAIATRLGDEELLSRVQRALRSEPARSF